MKRGHVPFRRCIVCRQRRPAAEMIRLKAQEDTVIVVGNKDNVPGRGCYVCPRLKCIEAGLDKGRLSRALRRNVAIVPTREALLRGQEQEEVTG